MIQALNLGPAWGLRDDIAMRAMTGDLAAQSAEMGEFTNDTPDELLEDRIRFYYRFADAMLRVKEAP